MNDTGIAADWTSSALLTVEPVKAFNIAYKKYPKIKYTTSRIIIAGVILEKSIVSPIITKSPLTHNLYDTKAVIINNNNWHNPNNPIATVLPKTIELGLVEVINVSITRDVFSLDTEVDTEYP